MLRKLFFVGHTRLILFSILSVLLGALISADAFVLQWLISVVQARQWHNFVVCVTVVCLVVLVQTAVYGGRQVYTERLSYLIMNHLREDIFGKLIRIPIFQIKQLSTDKLFSQLTTQLEQIKANLIDVVLYGFVLVFQVIFASVSVLVINPILGMCALLLCIPMALVPILTKQKVEAARSSMIDAQNSLNGDLGDLLHGIVDWRLMHRESKIQAWFAQHSDSWLDATRRDADVQMLVDSIANALSHVLIFGIWVIGGLLVMSDKLGVGQVVALYTLAGNISVPLFQMSGLVAQYHAGVETLRQLYTFTDDVDSMAPVSANDNSVSSSSSADAEGIQYCGVRLHHVGASFDVNLSLTGRYVVIGESGAGKSSFVRALVGLDDDYDGQITIGGVSARTFNSSSQTIIGYLSQQSHVFRGSIRENVRLFDETIDDAAVLHALNQAQLGEWVLERGLDWEIDNSLTLLSGGERQRLLLARIFVQGYDFCVLDEFDAGLDDATAAKIEQVILSNFAGYIAITHRHSQRLISEATAILHMADNTLVSAKDV